jgi:hypothetical protein
MHGLTGEQMVMLQKLLLTRFKEVTGAVLRK